MNLKNSMQEYRQFQRIRRENALLKRKMTTFTIVRFQHGMNPPVHDVQVSVIQGTFPNLGVILFEAANGFRDFFQEAASFNDREANKTNLRITFEAREDIVLTFNNEIQKEEFALVLKNFLRLSNRSSPDST